MKSLIRVIVIYLALPLHIVHGQTGHPFLSNFESTTTFVDNIQCIEHDAQNILFFGTPSGVYLFNSEEWQFIETPSAVLSLKYYEDGDKIIVGFFIVFLILTVATPLLISSHPLP